jgi:hypothetical protein
MRSSRKRRQRVRIAWRSWRSKAVPTVNKAYEISDAGRTFVAVVIQRTACGERTVQADRLARPAEQSAKQPPCQLLRDASQGVSKLLTWSRPEAHPAACQAEPLVSGRATSATEA